MRHERRTVAELLDAHQDDPSGFCQGALVALGGIRDLGVGAEGLSIQDLRLMVGVNPDAPVANILPQGTAGIRKYPSRSYFACPAKVLMEINQVARKDVFSREEIRQTIFWSFATRPISGI